jgi:excinuclease ABC subunit B
VNAEVVLYADSVTDSMQHALDETARRRVLQMDYNKKHGITPETIKKAIRRGIEEEIEAKKLTQKVIGAESESQYVTQEYLSELEAEMVAAAESLEFERAAKLRDRIVDLKKQMGKPVPTADDSTPQKKGGRRGRRGNRKPNPYR